MKQNCINDIAIIADESGSMSSLKNQVVDVLNAQIKNLSIRSKETDQDTRVSIYTFNSDVKCRIYSRDALRLPKFDDYNPGGNTALIDATLKAIDDLSKLPELYYDFAKLILVFSDGAENSSKHSASELAAKIRSLPDNWTLGVFVPDAIGESEAKKFGFPAGNVKQWSVGGTGMQEIGEVIRKTTDSYMSARAAGVRGTKSLFTLDTSNLNSGVVKNVLDELRPGTDHDIFPVRQDARIDEFVQSWTKSPLRLGSGYYQLSKKETIQPQKMICIQNRSNGKVYSGLNARKLLGLPDKVVDVKPADFGQWVVFIQSTAPNRRLIAGTQLLVLK